MLPPLEGWVLFFLHMQIDCISGAAGLPVWAAVLRPDWFTQDSQNSVSDPRHDWAGDPHGFFVWLWQSCAWTNCCTIEISLAKVQYTSHLTLGGFFFVFFFNVLWSSAWLPHNGWGILICPGKTGLAWTGRWYKKSPGQKPASKLCLEKRAARRGMHLEKITLSGLQAALGSKLNSLGVDRNRD